MTAETTHPLEAARRNLGRKYKSRAKFAALADVDETTIWRIEKRNGTVGFVVMLKLSRALGITEDEVRELLGEQVIA